MATLDIESGTLAEIALPEDMVGPWFMLVSSPTGILTMTADASDLNIARWRGGAFEPATVQPYATAGESARELRVCDDDGSMAQLIGRDDGALGVQTVIFDGEELARSATYYGSELGSADTAVGDLSGPVLSACAVHDGATWIAVLPADEPPRPPVVVRGSGARWSESPIIVGDRYGSTALAVNGPQMMAFVATDETLSVYALDSGAAVLRDSVATRLGTHPLILGAFPVDRGVVLILSSVGGLAAATWVDSVLSDPVRLIDFQCGLGYSQPLSVDGRVVLLAPCTLGVNGTDLVEISVCGS